MVREQKRVELTMARNDVQAKQEEYDRLAPDEATRRKADQAQAAANTYIENARPLMNAEVKLYDQTLNQVDTLANSATFILAQKYRNELKVKHNQVAKEYILEKEKAFTNRRRFLDRTPQEGVPGIGSFESIDEQILLLFWVCFILFIGTVMIYILERFKTIIDTNGKYAGAMVGGVGIAAGIAHAFIRAYSGGRF